MQASRFLAAAVILLAVAAPPLAAQCDTVTLTGRESWDALGDASNEVVTRDYSASGCTGGVTDIGWTAAELTTVGASWGTEAEIEATASDLSGAQNLDPFTGNNAAGSFGPVTATQGAGVTLLGDGLLRLEFHETFDDVGDSKDADWTAGTLDITPVDLQSFSVE